MTAIQEAQSQDMQDAQKVDENAIASIERVIREAHGHEVQRNSLQEMLNISRELPESITDIEPHVAEYLSGRFLRGIDLAGELYALAISFELKMEVLKKKEFSAAMLVRAPENGAKTAKEKEMYAYGDEQYLAVADRAIEAKMFRVLTEEKKSGFEKSFYLLKKIVERNRVVSDLPMANHNVENWVNKGGWG